MKKIIPIIMAVVVIMAMLTGCSFLENNHLLGTDKFNALETTEAAETADPEPAQANTEASSDVDANSATATGAAAIDVSAKGEPAPEPIVFVLIKLSEQRLWVLKGPEVTDNIDACSIVYETGIVSGTKGTKRATPTGKYEVYSKVKGTYLHPSDGGKVWVDYWMPFDGGIGMHDATWRGDDEFGTDQYRRSGSHGCINLPYESAAAIYHLVRIGTPVYVVD